MLVTAVFTFFALACVYAALTCFATTQDGVAEVARNPSWQFCGYTLKWTSEGGLDVANAFGISNVTDSLYGFDSMFAKHDARYEVLDLCVHEKDDLRGLSRKFSTGGLEFLLRCACDQDLCNGNVSFQNQIAAATD